MPLKFSVHTLRIAYKLKSQLWKKKETGGHSFVT